MRDHVFQLCQESFPDGNSTVMLQCVSEQFESQHYERALDLQSFLFVISGAMIFFMQSGFAMICAGAVRLKNVQNSMLKNLLDACGSAIAFYILGYALAYGDEETHDSTTFIGTSNFASVGPSSAFWFFQYTFSATSVTIVAGTLAERCQMTAYLCYSMVLAGLVYPVVAHSLWSINGFLSNVNADSLFGIGAIDFAGSGVVHLTGGTTALFATQVLGPRRGRFYNQKGEPLDPPKPMPGHSIALQLLGTMILWFGWFGFNAGSALVLGFDENDHVGYIAATAAASTALSGAGGGISALFTNFWIEERKTGEPHFSLVCAMNGSLAGLVAITSGCAVVEPWAALVTGLIAGWLYLFASKLLISKRIDDAVDAIPVHMANGIWGLFATGLFASPDKLQLAFNTSKHVGMFYSWGRGSSDATLLGCQVIAIAFILTWCLATMMPFFIWLNYKGWLRSDSLEELVGLDISYHGGKGSVGTGEIKPEYVDAYRQHKKKNNLSFTNNTSSAATDGWTSSNSKLSDDPEATGEESGERNEYKPSEYIG